jgi:hypothetical protein
VYERFDAEQEEERIVHERTAESIVIHDSEPGNTAVIEHSVVLSARVDCI